MDKVALVTGAGSGIGRAVTRRLLEDGWRAVLVGRRLEPLQETAAGSDRALCLTCDVSDPSQVEDTFAQAVDRFGRLDLLFNNAGGNVPPAPIDEISVEDWYKVVDVNLNGAFLCARAAFGQMRKQSPQGGRIINNGSISAQVPRPGSVPYSTTKFAITGLTKTLSLDGRPYDIACGQVDIGNTASDMTTKMAGGVPQADGSIKPEPVMDVKNVADTVAHMASLPLDANIQFVTVMATKMPFIGRG
ncbi:SDR family oxidoreductase [Oceanomicrobium pacificus]|uniref:SDR family NAD(P)-dependent oxidoreductase n=1 Tax=Oceanomicrobium pacificus TaxID=2692916 RepID=A0A6B0TRQ3_9RHOB|nr:SDR family oxidoreductase [Oceanomicrobium pacificus]MXU64495.1 SDR family NAD(P)-dependent oxidoreductase [Oceanomicrobium pacificus]